ESPSDAKRTISFANAGTRASRTATKESMPLFASYLSTETGRPVLDKTGLTGSYEFKLEWARDTTAEASAPPTEAGPSIFTAVQEQLGLKLESQRSPIDLIVIDHASKPGEN